MWDLDFIFDRTADRRPIKMLVVLDEYTRENIALEVSRKLKSHDVIMVLDELTAKIFAATMEVSSSRM